MPAKFDRCAAKKGSKIRTKRLPGKKYIRICVPTKGSSVGGYVKKKKS